MENSKKLQYIVEINVGNIEVETKKMVLVKINDDTKLWLPIKDLFLNTVRVHIFSLPVYENNTKKYMVVKKLKDGDSKKLYELNDIINFLKKQPTVNVIEINNKKEEI